MHTYRFRLLLNIALLTIVVFGPAARTETASVDAARIDNVERRRPARSECLDPALADALDKILDQLRKENDRQERLRALELRISRGEVGDGFVVEQLKLLSDPAEVPLSKIAEALNAPKTPTGETNSSAVTEQDVVLRGPSGPDTPLRDFYRALLGQISREHQTIQLRARRASYEAMDFQLRAKSAASGKLDPAAHQHIADELARIATSLHKLSRSASVRPLEASLPRSMSEKPNRH